MSKLVLLSIIGATIALPAMAARHKDPRKGLRKLIIRMLIFEGFYVFALLYLYGRI